MKEVKLLQKGKHASNNGGIEIGVLTYINVHGTNHRHCENFWAFTGLRTDFGLILLISNMVIHRSFTGPTHLLSANIRGPVSFTVSANSSNENDKKISMQLTKSFSKSSFSGGVQILLTADLLLTGWLLVDSSSWLVGMARGWWGTLPPE